ncbi:MAG: peptidoglycan DD-metalloendopeptidase family protein [Omnitrophica WOR_2 bacterium]
MPDQNHLDGFPGSRGELLETDEQPGQKRNAEGDLYKESRLLLLLEGLSRAGLGETVYRLGTHLLSLALILIVVWAMRAFYLRAQQENDAYVRLGAMAAALPSPTPTEITPELPNFAKIGFTFENGIPRLAVLHTDIPTRPRTDVITYTIQKGDTIFGVAEKFGLKPQTILWGNTYTLRDDPHLIQPGTVLNILPANGVYHKWSKGEGLNGVAKGYQVTVDAIMNWPGNHLDPKTIGDLSNPNIEPGTMLFVPGGSRGYVTWSAPYIGRTDPAKAKILGPGYCGTVVDGAVGTGTFIWPTAAHYLSGYDYSPETNHFGIDIAGSMGVPEYAADNGVVVYAGWNNWGYGNVVVLDHGRGWQTLYAHMSVINVICGQSVNQGSVIGFMGSTGNSSGPHLHFEMLNETYGKVNPWNFLPPP